MDYLALLTFDVSNIDMWKLKMSMYLKTLGMNIVPFPNMLKNNNSGWAILVQLESQSNWLTVLWKF